MAKKTESSKAFGLIDNNLTFSGQPAEYYLQDPLSRDIQSYIRRIVTENVYHQGSVAHLRLSASGAVVFQYQIADDESIHTAVFANTKSITFPAWQSKPSSHITFIDQGNVTKAEVGSASTNQKETGNINFAIIAQQPLNISDPDGFFIWIHPDTTIIPDSVTVIPFSQVNFEDSSPLMPPAIIMPTESIITRPPTPTSPPASEEADDGFDLSLLFNDD